MIEKTPRQILREELSYHQMLILGATISAFGFSAWYWTSLPTHGYTKFDAPALFAAFLGLCFVAVYEFSKLMAAKRGNHSNKFFIAFVVFSILTGVGTHMNSEQGATEEKMNRSALFNRELANIDQANAQIREYAYAASYDISSLEADRDTAVQKFLAQPALQSNGKESGVTVGAAISKGWKSYRHYNDQLADLKKQYDSKIDAAKLYASAKAAVDGSSSAATNTNATETAEASWLIQIIGQILSLFGINTKVNAWSSFVLYLFATIILEMTVRFNGGEIRKIRRQLYGYDISNLDQLSDFDATTVALHKLEREAVKLQREEKRMQENKEEYLDWVTPENRDPANKNPEETQTQGAPAVPEKPAMSGQQATLHVLEMLRNMTQSGALPLTRNHIATATRIEYKRLDKQHDLPAGIDTDAAAVWMYDTLAAERDAAKPAAAPTRPETAISPTVAIASAADRDAQPERRRAGFVDTDNRPRAELPQQPHPNGTGLHSPALGSAEAIYPLNLETKPAPAERVAERVADRVETTPAPSSNRVDTVQHAQNTRVDTVQHGSADTVTRFDQHAEQKPNVDDGETLKNAIAVIWKGIDNGAISRISVRDNSQCQAALKGHKIGKSNPARRELLAMVFDALGKEQVITRNPEYTDSSCGKSEWLINPARTLKYAA